MGDIHPTIKKIAKELSIKHLTNKDVEKISLELKPYAYRIFDCLGYKIKVHTNYKNGKYDCSLFIFQSNDYFFKGEKGIMLNEDELKLLDKKIDKILKEESDLFFKERTDKLFKSRELL